MKNQEQQNETVKNQGQQNETMKTMENLGQRNKTMQRMMCREKKFKRSKECATVAENICCMQFTVHCSIVLDLNTRF